VRKFYTAGATDVPIFSSNIRRTATQYDSRHTGSFLVDIKLLKRKLAQLSSCSPTALWLWGQCSSPFKWR